MTDRESREGPGDRDRAGEMDRIVRARARAVVVVLNERARMVDGRSSGGGREGGARDAAEGRAGRGRGNE